MAHNKRIIKGTNNGEEKEGNSEVSCAELPDTTDRLIKLMKTQSFGRERIFSPSHSHKC